MDVDVAASTGTETNAVPAPVPEAAREPEPEPEQDDDEVVDTSVVPGEGVPTFATSRLRAARNRSVRKRKDVLPEEAAEPPPACQEAEALGPFWFEAPRTLVVTDPATGRRVRRHRGITSLEKQRVLELLKAGFITPALLTEVVRVNDEASDAPRLRAHDHALTNRLKGKPRLKLVQQADGSTEFVDISVDYERQLEKDHRLLFDTFRRGTHLFFEVDGRVHYTTAGQLTYLRFAATHDVSSYVAAHEADIREQMKAVAAAKRARGDMEATEDGAERVEGAEGEGEGGEDETGTVAVDDALDGSASTAGPPRKRRRNQLTKPAAHFCRGAVFSNFAVTLGSEEEVEARQAAKATGAVRRLATRALAAPTKPKAEPKLAKAEAEAEAKTEEPETETARGPGLTTLALPVDPSLDALPASTWGHAAP